jgi:hypothetical protein
VVLARCNRTHVHRAGQAFAAIEDRHGEQRLEAPLRQVGELLEAGIEVGLRGDRHRLARRGRPAGQPLADRHSRWTRGGLDVRTVDRLQDELVRCLVVDVDEAGVGAEGAGHRDGHRIGDLGEVERARDSLDRLGEQAEMAGCARRGCGLGFTHTEPRRR